MAAENSRPKNLGLSTEQVIQIMEASARCGVLILKFQGLYFQFGKKTEPVPAPPGGPTEHAPKNLVAEMTNNQHQKLAAAALEQSELELREEQLEELKITNPVLYEELVNQGELDEDDADSDDDKSDE